MLRLALLLSTEISFENRKCHENVILEQNATWFMCITWKKPTWGNCSAGSSKMTKRKIQKVLNPMFEALRFGN